MKSGFHDIRLLAGFEIVPDSISSRVLNREQSEALAAALADDLARVVPGLSDAVLVACGSLLEPAELLRPGLPVWSGLSDLAGPLLRQHGTESQLLAIGSHAGRLPDQRLAPPESPILGQFIGIPLLLVVTGERGAALEALLESELFERGGLAPPARALLEQYSGAESRHGQLLTVNDLLALQHVQMDVAGLSAFWPVIEQSLLAPDRDANFELPAGLSAHWLAEPGRLEIPFLVFDRYPEAPEQYPLWQRAFRSLTGLAAAHGLDWQLCCDPDLIVDTQQQVLIHEAGATACADSLTEQNAPGLGLIAWTLAEQGRLRHVYPLSAAAASSTGQGLATSMERRHTTRLCYAGDPPRLQPA